MQGFGREMNRLNFRSCIFGRAFEVSGIEIDENYPGSIYLADIRFTSHHVTVTLSLLPPHLQGSLLLASPLSLSLSPGDLRSTGLKSAKDRTHGVVSSVICRFGSVKPFGYPSKPATCQPSTDCASQLAYLSNLNYRLGSYRPPS